MRICIWRWSRIKGIWQTAGMLLACWGLLQWPRAAAAGVSRGLAVCGQVLIPSLLPLLVLTDLFCRSGGAGGMGRRGAALTEKLFRLPGPCTLPLFIGMIGGYPAGAAALRTLLQTGRIDKKTAKRALPFCINAGPAFLIGTVGAGLLGSTYKGIVLYMCHITASLLLAFFCRSKEAPLSGQNLPPIKKAPFSKAFTESVAAALETLLGLCGFVMLFASFLSISDASGLTRAAASVMNFPFTLLGIPLDLSPLWPAFWEVSVGSTAAAAAPLSPSVSALLLGAAAGWGGISVHCQIRGLLGETAGKGFWRARLRHALLGGGLSGIAFALLPLPTVPDQGLAAWSTAVGAIRPVSVSAAASAALLVLCGTFLFNIDRFKA